MRVVCIADLQGMCFQVKPEMLPEGDMLLVAGDLGGWGTKEEMLIFDDWMSTLNYKYKIAVAGNHDECLKDIDGHKLFKNFAYLQDELIEVEGFRIYGTPASEMNDLKYFRTFADWSYVQQAAQKIPEDLDILLAHGPVYGILDKVSMGGYSVGSKPLRQAVMEKKPRYYVCGHIHESHGIEEGFSTTFVNAALCSERNQMLVDGKLYFEPIVIDL